jgi:hypothetical protein
MKFTLSFADFSAAVAAAGYTPLAQTDKVFVVKPKAKGAGKVEINLSSGTFYVGAGSRHVEALGTAVADYYKPIKQTKGWTVFMVPLATGTGAAEIMADFMKIVQLVEQATPKATGKAPKGTPKAPKAKATVADKVMKAVARVSKPQTAEQIMRAAEIKAKNLATMRAVTAKLNQEAA